MLSEQFLNIIDALKSGNIHKIKQSIDQFLKISSSDLFNSFGLFVIFTFAPDFSNPFFTLLRFPTP